MSHGSFVIIASAMEKGMGGKAVDDTGRRYEIQGDGSLGQEFVPKIEWGLFVDSGQERNEMI